MKIQGRMSFGSGCFLYIDGTGMGSGQLLKDMSIEEKMKTMEELWDDLVSYAESVPSPDWHQHVLDDRQRGLKEGVEEAIDWSSAKKSLK